MIYKTIKEGEFTAFLFFNAGGGGEGGFKFSFQAICMSTTSKPSLFIHIALKAFERIVITSYVTEMPGVIYLL